MMLLSHGLFDFLMDHTRYNAHRKFLET